MIKTVIFDMDGLLIDSEPLWHEAEIAAFRKVNIHMSREDCMETTGFRIDEVVDHRYRKQPWEGMDKEQMIEEINTKIIQLINKKGELKPGAEKALQFVQGKDVKIALASSSDHIVIRAVLDKFNWSSTFKVVHSAEDEDYGKPHPAVYLAASRKLGVQPESCLAIEDSLAGVIAAKAAKMLCLAIPEKEDKRFVLADMVLTSLTELEAAVWQKLNTI